MFSRAVIFILIIALVGATAGQPGKKIENNLFDDDNVYQPIIIRRSSNNNNNYDKSNVYNLIQPISGDLYDDDSSSNKVAAVEYPLETKAITKDGSVYDEEAAAKAAEERIKTIAFNSREYRLVGPQQKEVEMKDDVGTKMMIALENLGKEATDVWDQVNTKLDKGWTEFKAMVEGALSSTKKASSP